MGFLLELSEGSLKGTGDSESDPSMHHSDQENGMKESQGQDRSRLPFPDSDMGRKQGK